MSYNYMNEKHSKMLRSILAKFTALCLKYSTTFRETNKETKKQRNKLKRFGCYYLHNNASIYIQLFQKQLNDAGDNTPSNEKVPKCLVHLDF